MAIKGRDKEFRAPKVSYLEFKHTEMALRRSEAGLANAQRIARLGSWDWNVATGELTWSEEVYRIFDRDPDDF